MNLTELYLTDKSHYGDYVPTPGGDLATDSGVTNLRNALFRRLVTSPGSIVHRPDYGVGIKSYQNKLNSLTNQQAIALNINEQFIQDTRVESVDSVSVNQDPITPELTTIIVKLTPIGQDQITVTFTPFSGG